MSWFWRTLKRLEAPDLTEDKFWSAINVWNTRPQLLIKNVMNAERLFTGSFAGNSSNVFDLLVEQPVTWAQMPAETFQMLGIHIGGDVQVELWKLLTKKPDSWKDYMRFSIFGKSEHLIKYVIKLRDL